MKRYLFLAPAIASFAAIVPRPAAAVVPTSCHDRYLAGRAIPKQVEGWVCADPALAALERAAFKTFADQRRVAEWEAIDSENTLRLELEKCRQAACVRNAYQGRLDEIISSEPFPLSQGRNLRLRDGDLRADIWSRDLGDGWRVFKFGIIQGFPPEPTPQDWAGQGAFEGAEMFVARMIDGRTRYRRADGGGFDIQIRRDGSWKVDQLGDCACAAGRPLNYSGVYR